ncbi:MAG: DUF512 domain-containing protein [Defluviitaleaceae bacterium]|nr:DUF512 domain-containing protein [Defluviitaleaceae bacterium]
MHKIKEVLRGSIAEELEIAAGDFLLQINGLEIIDVLDYMFLVQAEVVILEVQKAAKPLSVVTDGVPAHAEGASPLSSDCSVDVLRSTQNINGVGMSPRSLDSLPVHAEQGEIWELEIEKDPDEDLGIIFEQPLLSKKRHCCNNCIFCFVDRQPRGLRQSLYVKDDDIRLSFLHGSYVTLTNLSPKEIARIAGYHLSPLRISVHAADLQLRKKMLGTEKAGNLFDALRVFGEAGISMHFQVVLCKGINDGEQLDYTIRKLAEQKGAESLAIVPVGCGREEEVLRGFSQVDAENVIGQVERWQGVFLQKMGRRFVFCADEWYVLAKRTLPKFEEYEDFPQLDNGVGMLRLFGEEFGERRGEASECRIGIITGFAAENFMRELTHDFENVTVIPIVNNFFGEKITVSGLLTGADIIAQLKGKAANEFDILFLPQNAFCDEVMLDGTTVDMLERELGVRVRVGSGDGGEFYTQLTTAQTTARP